MGRTISLYNKNKWYITKKAGKELDLYRYDEVHFDIKNNIIELAFINSGYNLNLGLKCVELRKATERDGFSFLSKSLSEYCRKKCAALKSSVVKFDFSVEEENDDFLIISFSLDSFINMKEPEQENKDNVDKTSDIAKRLRKYNEWRRGADVDQPEPIGIGRDIDDAVNILLSHTDNNKSHCRIERSIIQRIRVVLEDAKENTIELLNERDAKFGRTTKRNALVASMYENEIDEIDELLYKLSPLNIYNMVLPIGDTDEPSENA